MMRDDALAAGDALPATPWRTELAATFRLSWPLALANLLQMLTYAVDVIFIARLGEEPLAASALAIALFGLVLWALSGLTGAVAPVIAADLGASRTRRAPALRPVRRATRMALWLAVIGGAGGHDPVSRHRTIGAHDRSATCDRHVGQRIYGGNRLVDDPPAAWQCPAQFRICIGPPDFRHCHHGGRDRDKCRGELRIRVRQLGRAGTGPDRCGAGHHRNRAGYAGRLYRGNCHGQADAPLSHIRAVVGARLAALHQHRAYRHPHRADHHGGSGHFRCGGIPDGQYRHRATGRAYGGIADRGAGVSGAVRRGAGGNDPRGLFLRRPRPGGDGPRRMVRHFRGRFVHGRILRGDGADAAQFAARSISIPMPQRMRCWSASR